MTWPFITKSRHEREMEALGKELNDAAELVKGVEPHRRLWLSDRVAIVIAQRDEFEAKFKKAITDLEAQAMEIENLQTRLVEAEQDCFEWKSAALGYEPDAVKWQACLKRSRDRKDAKRAAKAPVKGVARG